MLAFVWVFCSQDAAKLVIETLSRNCSLQLSFADADVLIYIRETHVPLNRTLYGICLTIILCFGELGNQLGWAVFITRDVMDQGLVDR